MFYCNDKISFYLSLIIPICLIPFSCAIKCETKCLDNDPAVKKLQEYVKIDTSNGKNLHPAIKFLERQAAEIGLPVSVYYPDGKPICVISWIGANRFLPSIMLNSHLDVVPAEAKYWPYPPFSGHIDENCNIHGRGTQDTKGVTIQYLEAIRKLKQNNVTLQRTLHVTVMPDEETGGFQGMKPFLRTEEFKALNVGFVLDEGLTSDDDTILVSYQDKRPWQMKFTVFGEAGHGSTIGSSTAMEKMYKLLTVIMKFREEQNQIRLKLDQYDYGAYTTVNINMISGGTITNVKPSEVSCVVDMRLAVDAKEKDVQAMLESWRIAAGNDTTLDFIRRDVVSDATPLECNPYWQAMLESANDMCITLKPVVLPASSDVIVMRNLGIPAVGFAPKYRTPALAHANDEYINVEVFKNGIDIYVNMLKSLGNVKCV